MLNLFYICIKLRLQVLKNNIKIGIINLKIYILKMRIYLNDLMYNKII